ncbi:GNAT family N-acetyltransferase [Bosea sp. 2YAB26]
MTKVAGSHWRTMSVSDLDAVVAVAAEVHPDFPEEAAIFAERLKLFGDGCRVLDMGSGIAAYLLSHPWRELEPPALNAPLGALPPAPGTFYIHDLALLPQARGTGAAVLAVADALRLAQKFGLPSLSLVAVNASVGFWGKQGFSVVADPRLEAKLASYGSEARFMMRLVAGAD